MVELVKEEIVNLRRDLKTKSIPVTAIIPILNCADRLREHMEKSMEWLPYVREIIVVDSYSDDGSLDIIKEYVDSLDITILQRPKGLYAAWNFGIKHSSSDFVYFSTVGDHISLFGLGRLLDVAHFLHADVVISPPKFVGEDNTGQINGTVWPIHDIIRTLELSEPTLIEPRLLYDFILIFLERAVLGSSASNLYRREKLEEFPFSDKFYSAGDSAWIIDNNFDLKVAICPEAFSTYLFHEKDWSYDVGQLDRSLELRRIFAYKAFKKSLLYSPSVDPKVIDALNVMIEKSLGSDKGNILPCDQKMLEIISGKTSSSSNTNLILLYQVNAIQYRIKYLHARQLEKIYKVKFRALRHLWIPSLINRSRKKTSKRKLVALLESLQGRP